MDVSRPAVQSCHDRAEASCRSIHLVLLAAEDRMHASGSIQSLPLVPSTCNSQGEEAKLRRAFDADDTARLPPPSPCSSQGSLTEICLDTPGSRLAARRNIPNQPTSTVPRDGGPGNLSVCSPRSQLAVVARLVMGTPNGKIQGAGNCPQLLPRFVLRFPEALVRCHCFPK